MMKKRFLALPLLAALALGACGGEETPPEGKAPAVDLTQPVHVDLNASVPRYLSEYNLFAYTKADGFVFHEDVVPYEMNSALFTDYALKSRAIYIPEGTTIAYHDNDVFDFPVGTLILKTFYYAEDLRKPTENLRLVETRVLIRYEDGWRAHPYVWNAAQTQAELMVTGQISPQTFINLDGESVTTDYLVPSRNQCGTCHTRKTEEGATATFLPIGPRARYLNRDHAYGEDGVRNQLEYLSARGMLTGLPELEDVPAAYDFRQIEETGLAGRSKEEINVAARDYLDINCAHCHSPVGVQGITSQLFLNHDNNKAFNLGVCKRPGSAGNGTGGFDYDIVPSDPETSILHFRMDTVTAGQMMPLLGRSLKHTEGVELIHAWIAQMDVNENCPPKDFGTEEP